MDPHEPLTAVAVAAELEYGTDTAAEMERLLEGLRRDRPGAKAILESLVDHPSFSVRSWVPRGARLVLGREGAPLIKRLVRDRDPDVRDAAIEELVELDPAEATFLAPALRRRLKSEDLYEPMTAMWTLARIRDRGSLELIRNRARNSEYEWHRRSAEVVAMLLEEREAEVVSRMLRHDHDYMPWLPEAAQLLGTPGALAALEDCAERAPDVECQHHCREALKRHRRRTT